MDFRTLEWISWISGIQNGFLDFKFDFWISQWISGFQFELLPMVYEISFVTDPLVLATALEPCKRIKVYTPFTRYIHILATHFWYQILDPAQLHWVTSHFDTSVKCAHLVEHGWLCFSPHLFMWLRLSPISIPRGILSRHLASLYIQWLCFLVRQGRQNRSGQPSNRQTNVSLRCCHQPFT